MHPGRIDVLTRRQCNLVIARASGVKHGNSRSARARRDHAREIPRGRAANRGDIVEGDILKLTITGTGTFVYKQIGPIERKRVVGTLEQTSSGGYLVHGEDKKWRVLTASVTYFKGKNADEVVVLVPKAGESKWAAVENIVKSAK